MDSYSRDWKLRSRRRLYHTYCFRVSYSGSVASCLVLSPSFSRVSSTYVYFFYVSLWTRALLFAPLTRRRYWQELLWAININRLGASWSGNSVLHSTQWKYWASFDFLSISKVQRRFTKRLTGYSYSERLQKLNLQSLELRRIHYDLTLTYQIVFGLTVLKCQEFFQLSGLSTTRGHQFKLMKQQCVSWLSETFLYY